MESLLSTDFPDLELYGRGKVRDIYRVGDALLIVATDRISAYDHVLATGIPGKGKILTQLSLFWYKFLEDLVPNHLITGDINEYPAVLQPYREQLYLRSMLVRPAEMFPIECVVRGYLSGSGWREYQQTGSICGVALPKGLRESDRLPEPLFTPATKAADGEHDVNISVHDAGQLMGPTNVELLSDLSLMIYDRASRHIARQGLILADTKFEFGMTPQGVVLADEVLTPDSSRYWSQSDYRPGGPQNSFDKQYVRDYLTESKWDRQPPAPALPMNVVAMTQEKYMEAYRRVTGRATLEG